MNLSKQRLVQRVSDKYGKASGEAGHARRLLLSESVAFHTIMDILDNGLPGLPEASATAPDPTPTVQMFRHSTVIKLPSSGEFVAVCNQGEVVFCEYLANYHGR